MFRVSVGKLDCYFLQISSFHPNDGSQVATVVDNKVLIWNIHGGSPKLSCKMTMEAKGKNRLIKWLKVGMMNSRA